MAEQQIAALVKQMQAEGVPEAEILAFIDQFDGAAPTASRGVDTPARPIATGGGRGTGLDVRKSNQWASENAPAIGAALTTAATGGLSAPLSLPAMMLTAGAGGAAGAAARGDDAEGITTQAMLQGALQGSPAALKKIAGITYRVAIPKQIQDKFSKAPMVIEGLRNRVLMGTKTGTRAAERAGETAAGKVQAAAPSVPPMTGQNVSDAFARKRARGVAGRKTARVSEIDEYVQNAQKEIGPTPMTGDEQLARKEFLEPESKAAMGQANSNMAAVNPQLANIERKAIVRNLRSSPDMASALNQSQAAVGLGRAAQATENSTVLNRLSGPGGIWNAAKSPVGFSGAGIALNEVGRINPQVVRLLDLIMRSGSHE